MKEIKRGVPFKVFKKSKNGRKSLFAIDFNFPLIIMIIVLLLALIVPYCFKGVH